MPSEEAADLVLVGELRLEPPCDIISCSWPRPVIQENGHWTSEPEWDAPIMPIHTREADVTGLENGFVLELPTGAFWRTRRDLHQRMFVGDVHGGTLVYRKAIWQEGGRYPEVNLAEDAWFLWRALARGKRLRRLANPGVFLYVRHGQNAWREFAPGTFLNPSGWERTTPPPLFSTSNLDLYKNFGLS